MNASMNNANHDFATEKTQLLEKLAALKAAEKAAKEEAKAARQALKEAEKASRKPSELDQLAGVIISVCSVDGGATKAAILKAYLEALGVDANDPAAIKKAATLNAQLGRRIMPRLAQRGYSLRSERHMDEKACRYIAERLPENNE